jgi:hypothetical protein
MLEASISNQDLHPTPYAFVEQEASARLQAFFDTVYNAPPAVQRASDWARSEITGNMAFSAAGDVNNLLFAKAWEKPTIGAGRSVIRQTCGADVRQYCRKDNISNIQSDVTFAKI